MIGKFVRTDTGYVFVKAPDIPEHFFLMGETERKLVADWHKGKKGKTKKQNEFLERVKTAIEVVTYDYSIATIEPSQDENGKICYESGKTVLRGLSFNEGLTKAKEFMPDMGSDLASLPELDLWNAYRIAKGYWTIAYVCDDSSSTGNYWNAPNATHNYETSGVRTVGGFADGVGNTYKLVKDPKSGFWLCGGCYHDLGYRCPVASAGHYDVTFDGRFTASGCIVLRK